MTETFNFCVDATSSGEVNQRVQTSDFGDGYSQATSVGINNQAETWNISKTGNPTEIAPIKEFLKRHKGAKSFFWTPPNGVQGLYRTSKFNLAPESGNLVWSLSAQFTQVFDGGSSTGESDYVLSVNNVPPDEEGNVDLSASDVGADPQGTAAKAIEALKKETDPFTQYAKKSDIPDLTSVNAKFKEVDDELERLDGEVVNLNGTLGQTNNHLTELEQHVTGIDTTLLKVESDVSAHTGKIATLETTVSTNTATISLIESSMVKSVNGKTPDNTGNVEVDAGGAEIDDTQPSTAKVYSSAKTEQLISGLSSEIAAKAEIDDTEPQDDKVYSSAKTKQLVDDLINAGLPLFSVIWWPSRDHIPAGYVAADGQELSRLTYPDAAQAITDNKVPTVSNDVWLANPTTRGCYVALSSDGMFRVPDYNGKQADSLGALFLRGDNGSVANGNIQLDEIREHSHAYDSRNSPGATASAGGLPNLLLGSEQTGLTGGEETRPINVSGCWIIRLFGAITNVGSADASQLASDIANLTSRVSVLEGKSTDFTIIYPNSGTAENPANVTANNRYVMDNPFTGNKVICTVELLVNGIWADPNFIYDSAGGLGMGTKAHHLIEDDTIIVQTGSGNVMVRSTLGGGGHGYTGANVATAPCRVKVWRIN